MELFVWETMVVYNGHRLLRSVVCTRKENFSLEKFLLHQSERNRGKAEL